MLSERHHQHLVHFREIITVFAILAGGVWAVLQFILLYQSDIAELNLRKLQKELDYHPVMQLSLDLKTWRSETEGYLLEAVAKVSNAGKLQDILDLSQQPFRIYPVVFRENVPAPVKAWGELNLDFPAIHSVTRLLPGESQSFRILYQLPEARIYYVEFAVPLSKESRKHWPEGIESGNFIWSTGRFIEVVESSD